jgi:translation initiation factor IF-1
MNHGERQVVIGVILRAGPNFDCSVRLDSGDVVRARIPRRNARPMFRVVPGDRVRIHAPGPESFVVLGHERQDRAEPGTTADCPGD